MEVPSSFPPRGPRRHAPHQRIAEKAVRRLDALDMLWAGGLGLFGLGLSDLLRQEGLQAASSRKHVARSFGKAKSCILLFLYGSPSQLETVDPKPDAPVEIRGEI